MPFIVQHFTRELRNGFELRIGQCSYPLKFVVLVTCVKTMQVISQHYCINANKQVTRSTIERESLREFERNYITFKLN